MNIKKREDLELQDTNISDILDIIELSEKPLTDFYMFDEYDLDSKKYNFDIQDVGDKHGK